ncbi:MAG: aminopeptidase P family protein [Chloroflexi bacterium]|nr:aminopeptidase P family protein [Chloroflexota bacterium]MBI3340954.1 aminopeptidase P family protein [Chloroflexota bacterium]
MKSDLDALMQSKKLDAIVVLGNAEHNPPMYYFTGGGHVSNAALFKKPGQEAVLYCNAMERAEAARSGLKVIPLRTGAVDVLVKTPKDIFIGQGITSGRVGLYGTLDVGDLVAMTGAIRSALPEIELVGEPKEDSIFLRAMETKDKAEVERIRKMGKTTTEVVGMVAKYLMNCEVRDDEVLLKENGAPLTIADVKSKISLWLAERGAADVEGCIFAIGKDAGVPHSVGTPEDLMRLGQTIVFDIFPAEAGGGYFYDFTRTWSLGYATPEAQKLYNEVQDVYNKVVDNLDLNVGFKEYQKLVCDEFHKNGHKTPMHTEGVLENGYVHSLGHGLGLNVHERPWSRHNVADDNILRPGVVITIEPGLYYPEKGMGARIEDSYYVRTDGKMELLAEYPYDFVLPMKKWKKK